MPLLPSIGLFVVAGLCEIGGGYLVWLWFREGRPLGYGIAGAAILILYGVIPTFQPATLLGSMPPMAGCSLCCRFSGDGRWMV
jgi:drug/metabolite transporter superfamily protein YnfA